MIWIGVDLDGTLAHYEEWGNGEIGKPIPAMVQKVKEFLAGGFEVRIFTARVSKTGEDGDLQREMIRAWCEKHIGIKLPVTCSKDFEMLSLYDDRCVKVETNTGRIIQ